MLSWLTIFAGTLFAIPANAADPLLVGAAKVDITPDYPIWLNGYAARKTESVGVGQKIWAKALAIGADDAHPVVLITLDNLGIPDELVAQLSKDLEKAAGIPRASLCISASHTHSAPCLTNLAPHILGRAFTKDEQLTIDRYTAELAAKLKTVAYAALKDRRPCHLSWGEGKASFAINRRTKGGKGPVDHALPMLVAKNIDGSIRAILVNYACHCVTMAPADNLIHGDWAGFVQEGLEKDHPGAIALTMVGCGADSNPSAMHGADSTDKATKHAQSIITEVNRLLHTTLKPLATVPTSRTKRIDLPYDKIPTRAEFEALVKKGGYPGYNASTFLAKLDRGESIPDQIDYPITTWQFADDLMMVFLPGEVVVDYSLRLKKEYDASRLWISAYSNDAPCYIPSERVLKEGGYEGGGAMVYYAKPTRFKTGIETLIINAIHDLIPANFLREPMPPKLSPSAAIEAIKIKPGLKVELVAAEPLIQSPVAIDWGVDGTLWVAEMRDYPMGMDGNFSPGGVIKALTDTDGDGKYDKSVEFLTGLAMPTGVMAYQKGVLISSAPNIIYAYDENGDGKADKQSIIFTGFSTENQQARVNSLMFNLDNQIYGASGIFGGRVTATAGGAPVDLGGRDFRLTYDLKTLEAVTGITQQGRTHDDWGDQFGCNNGNLIFHFPFPDTYARRNPFLPTPSPSVTVPRDKDANRLYPASVTLERYNDPHSANHVTSGCGVCIYRDTLMDTQYRGDAFTCEPVHNLVHREHLGPDGVTFASHRAPDEKDTEFLASTDPWFRPVQARTGPDGCLYVVDMARFVIEHPRWIGPDQLATLDVRAGHDRGRIYRVLPISATPRPVPRLNELSTEQLAQALDNPNGTLRDNVHRYLLERADPAAIPILENLAKTSRRAEVRCHALSLLDGLGHLSTALLLKAITDLDPNVRRTAVRLSEPRIPTDEILANACLNLKGDPDTRVRFQLALTLGNYDSPLARKALGLIGTTSIQDPWIRAAVLSSSTNGAEQILATVLPRVDDRGRSLVDSLVRVVGHGTPEDIAIALESLLDTKGEPLALWRMGALTALLESVDTKVLEPMLNVRERLEPVDHQALQLLGNPEGPTKPRVVAAAWLARPGSTRANLDAAIEQLAPTTPIEIQSTIISTFERTNTPNFADILVSRWTSFGPVLRGKALDALTERATSAWTLLIAVERGKIAAGEIDPSHRQTLLTHHDLDVRTKAATLLGQDRGGRAAVLDAYRSTRPDQGDRTRGVAVFGRVCAGCHKLAEQGVEIGPDIAALTDRSPEAFLTAIFDPNRDVDSRYMVYQANLIDGRSLNGIIATETANTLILKKQGGQPDSVLRSTIESLNASGKSLMPEGLEAQLTKSDYADLLAYLAAGDEKPRTLAGNTPKTIDPLPDGSIRLPAANAEIYGPSLAFEPEFGNLGMWHTPSDRASWTFKAAKAGVHVVTIDFACAAESAGNAYEISSGASRARRVTGSTGAWSNYRSIFIFEANLKPGLNRLDIKPLGPIHNALFDVRTVVLTPR
jgi:putative membrane-bound dehydrogenase-like protein